MARPLLPIKPQPLERLIGFHVPVGEMNAPVYNRLSEETIDNVLTVVNIERDSEGWVTMYTDDTDGGLCHYFVLSQAIIDKLKTI